MINLLFVCASAWSNHIFNETSINLRQNIRRESAVKNDLKCMIGEMSMTRGYKANNNLPPSFGYNMQGNLRESSFRCDLKFFNKFKASCPNAAAVKRSNLTRFMQPCYCLVAVK